MSAAVMISEPSARILLVEQADRIVLGIVGAEAVGADHLREPVGLVSRRHVATAAHFAEPDLQGPPGQLPGGLRSGEAAADDRVLDNPCAPH